MVKTPGHHQLPKALYSARGYLNKAWHRGLLSRMEKEKMGKTDFQDYFRFDAENMSIECYRDDFDVDSMNLYSRLMFVLADAYLDLAESSENNMNFETGFNAKPFLDKGILDSFPNPTRIDFFENGFRLFLVATSKTLSQVTREAMAEAEKNGKAFVDEPISRLSTIRTYMYMYQKSYSCNFTIDIDSGRIFIAVKSEGATSNQWEDELKGIGRWGHLCIPIDDLGYSLQYFRSWAKTFCPKGSDFIIKVQHSLKRVLVLRIENEDELHIQEWDEDVVNPEWDDNDVEDDGEVMFDEDEFGQELGDENGLL